MNAKQIDRRKFLGRLGMGAGVGALGPLFPLMDREATAAGGYPLRFVTFWNGTGNCFIGDWQPTGSETNFTLSDVLGPLQPFKSQLVVVEGLYNKAAEAAGGDLAHVTQVSKCLTGAGAGSIDQLIGDAIRGSAPFHSLLFRSPGPYGGGASLSYRGTGNVPGEFDPQTSFNRIFPSSFKPPVGGNPGPAPDPQAAVRELTAQRRRLFDVVARDTQRAKDLVGAAGYEKIDKYRAGLEDVVKRLEALTGGVAPGGGPAGSGTCATPMVSTSGAAGDLAQYVPIGRANQSLASAALACDRTRVAVLQWGGGPGGGGVPEAGVAPKVNGTNSYHQLGHFALNGQGAKRTDYNASYPEIKRLLMKFYAKQLADFLGSLAAVREGTGTLLDNTLVLWANGMAYGGHIFTRDGIPHVLVVGKNVASAVGLNMGTGGGRYLKHIGTSHVQLLTSVLHMMGLKDGGTPLSGLV